ncbi:MAG: hypothetical protein EBR19_06915, partial [Chitinophagaceae bacterium]|nr:hypothetical protein [Chitinophagaceae bacterium]
MFAKQVKQSILSLAHLGRKDPILQKLLNHTLAWGDVPEEPVVLDEGELERRAFVNRFKNHSQLTQKKRAIRFEDEVEPYYVYEAIADAPISVAPISVAP